MAHRAGALSRGPPGPAHAPVGDEGLGLRLAWTTLGLGRRDGRGRQSVLARALPELQDHVPVPRGQLRAGRRRAGALHRRRVSVVHPRHSPHGGGIAPHEPGLPPSSDPGHAMTSLLQQWVTEQAERRPDATAVVMHGARMTYEELEASSNRLARTLKAAGCQQGDRVALLLAKSPLAIVSMVGTLKADCTYVPLDASSPAPQRDPLCRVGEAVFRPGTNGSRIRSSAAALRSLHVRRVWDVRVRRPAAPRAARDQPAADCPRQVHPGRGTDAMVLGAVAAELHGQVRCRAVQRLSGPAAAPVVWRGLPHASPEVLDDAAAARDLHEPVRSYEDDDLEKRLHRSDLSGGRERGDPDRDAVRG